MPAQHRLRPCVVQIRQHTRQRCDRVKRHDTRCQRGPRVCDVRGGLRPGERRGVHDEARVVLAAEREALEREDMRTRDVAHVDELVRCRGDGAAGDDLQDEVVRAHARDVCGQGEGRAVRADHVAREDWIVRPVSDRSDERTRNETDWWRPRARDARERSPRARSPP